MIFYDCKTAPSPRRARMFLAEKGLSPEVRDVEIAKGAQLAPEFLALNPRGTLPVLVTDKGTALTENVAIAAWLEDTHPEPPLMGRDPDERAAVLMWNAIIEQNGLAAIADAFRNAHPQMKGRALTGPETVDQIPELAERGRVRAERFFTMLDERLAASPFVAGDAFSFADITAFVTVDFARIIKLRPSDAAPALLAWFETIGARPSATL